MLHRRREAAGASAHLLEHAVRVVHFLRLQFLVVECAVIEVVLSVDSWQ